ncbi:MAG: bifunctional precorrin-2 dehydrogenase/sirohydrochlorin ferrochelatase [Gammaproteobacteria bacterium]|nr:bifunctional precorrin-2 dehydrogenase/sirohydrochlorin ferrochelatase [Gammaproteobacteria bacterium]
MSSKKKLFPLMLNLSDKSVIIVGAGKVAERKAKLFLEYADVTLINLDFNKRLHQLHDENRLTLVESNLTQLSDKQLEELFCTAFLVIPSTGDKSLNHRISEIAKSCGAMINEVDSVGEVVIPSVMSHGDLTIGISTNGTSPALSKYTRKKIEEFISPSYADMARLQEEMREHYKQTISDQKQRKQLLWKILENDKIWIALSKSYEQALQMAQQLTINNS